MPFLLAPSPDKVMDLCPSTAASARHPRVLIVTENASPAMGGEAVLPLHYFRRLRSRGIETWLIVHERNREQLAALLPSEASRIHYVRETKLTKKLSSAFPRIQGAIRNCTLSLAMRHTSQVEALRITKELVARHKIDVIHQPTPVSPKEPSLLRNVGVPVVMGPMNGGMSLPPDYASSRGRLSVIVTAIGRSASGLFHRLAPGKLEADLLLVSNERTRLALPACTRGKIEHLVENGVDLSLWQQSDRPTNAKGSPIRFIFAGRLESWKGGRLAIGAFAQLRQTCAATLDIIGDGETREAMEEQVRSLRLTESVHFLGWMPQEQVAKRFAESDVFVLPSYFECGGAVVLEAMACGLPVIAMDWGGPADYVTPETGLLLPPQAEPLFIQSLAKAMAQLALNPELRTAMGRAGRTRVETCFDWERKIDQIIEIYERAMARR